LRCTRTLRVTHTAAFPVTFPVTVAVYTVTVTLRSRLRGCTRLLHTHAFCPFVPVTLLPRGLPRVYVYGFCRVCCRYVWVQRSRLIPHVLLPLRCCLFMGVTITTLLLLICCTLRYVHTFTFIYVVTLLLLLFVGWFTVACPFCVITSCIYGFCGYAPRLRGFWFGCRTGSAARLRLDCAGYLHAAPVSRLPTRIAFHAYCTATRLLPLRTHTVCLPFAVTGYHCYAAVLQPYLLPEHARSRIRLHGLLHAFHCGCWFTDSSWILLRLLVGLDAVPHRVPGLPYVLRGLPVPHGYARARARAHTPSLLVTCYAHTPPAHGYVADCGLLPVANVPRLRFAFYTGYTHLFGLDATRCYRLPFYTFTPPFGWLPRIPHTFADCRTRSLPLRCAPHTALRLRSATFYTARMPRLHTLPVALLRLHTVATTLPHTTRLFCVRFAIGSRILYRFGRFGCRCYAQLDFTRLPFVYACRTRWILRIWLFTLHYRYTYAFCVCLVCYTFFYRSAVYARFPLPVAVTLRVVWLPLHVWLPAVYHRFTLPLRFIRVAITVTFTFYTHYARLPATTAYVPGYGCVRGYTRLVACRIHHVCSVYCFWIATHAHTHGLDDLVWIPYGWLRFYLWFTRTLRSGFVLDGLDYGFPRSLHRLRTPAPACGYVYAHTRRVYTPQFCRLRFVLPFPFIRCGSHFTFTALRCCRLPFTVLPVTCYGCLQLPHGYRSVDLHCRSWFVTVTYTVYHCGFARLVADYTTFTAFAAHATRATGFSFWLPAHRVSALGLLHRFCARLVVHCWFTVRTPRLQFPRAATLQFLPHTLVSVCHPARLRLRLPARLPRSAVVRSPRGWIRTRVYGYVYARLRITTQLRLPRLPVCSVRLPAPRVYRTVCHHAPPHVAAQFAPAFLPRIPPLPFAVATRTFLGFCCSWLHRCLYVWLHTRVRGSRLDWIRITAGAFDSFILDFTRLRLPHAFAYYGYATFLRTFVAGSLRCYVVRSIAVVTAVAVAYALVVAVTYHTYTYWFTLPACLPFMPYHTVVAAPCAQLLRLPHTLRSGCSTFGYWLLRRLLPVYVLPPHHIPHPPVLRFVTAFCRSPLDAYLRFFTRFTPVGYVLVGFSWLRILYHGYGFIHGFCRIAGCTRCLVTARCRFAALPRFWILRIRVRCRLWLRYWFFGSGFDSAACPVAPLPSLRTVPVRGYVARLVALWTRTTPDVPPLPLHWFPTLPLRTVWIDLRLFGCRLQVTALYAHVHARLPHLLRLLRARLVYVATRGYARGFCLPFFARITCGYYARSGSGCVGLRGLRLRLRWFRSFTVTPRAYPVLHGSRTPVCDLPAAAAYAGALDSHVWFYVYGSLPRTYCARLLPFAVTVTHCVLVTFFVATHGYVRGCRYAVAVLRFHTCRWFAGFSVCGLDYRVPGLLPCTLPVVH